VTSRQVELSSCGAFVRALLRSLEDAGVRDEHLQQVLQEAVHPVCATCGLHLRAKDLILLSSSEAPDPAVDAKAHRLWQGYCGRSGCEARYYEFAFNPHPAVDWAGILRAAEGLSIEDVPAKAAQPETAEMAEARLKRRRLTRRVLAGAVVVAILLLARHWMTGGTIPFIREPADYQVDPTSVTDGPTDR
jgi:hypothetical protein